MALRTTLMRLTKSSSVSRAMPAMQTLEGFDSPDVDMDDYQMPLNYDLDKAVEAIKNGDGFFLLKKMFSKKDVQIARSAVDHFTKHERVDTNTDHSTSAKHNSYGDSSGGIIWRLIGKDKIFDKFALHPANLEISRALLGPTCQISSYMSNTVKPGMGGQYPHIDYPYYDGFFPEKEQNMSRPVLSIGIMMMLSDFTVKNGGTAVRPGSQIEPSYPHDAEDFYRNSVQLQGEAGDVGIFSASTQHCAMANNCTSPRVGIVMSMTPIYLRPYHEIKLNNEQLAEAPEELKKILGVGHPYPMQHG